MLLSLLKRGVQVYCGSEHGDIWLPDEVLAARASSLFSSSYEGVSAMRREVGERRALESVHAVQSV